MIAIINYEAGNLTSVQRALTHLGAASVITQDLGEIAQAERVIFPGVGAAGAAMGSLRRLGLDEALKDAVASGRPVLGICLGTQVIFESSQEDLASCLGILPGQTVRFPLEHRDTGGAALKVPHMGWNKVRWLKKHPVFAGLPQEAEFYFVHSFHPAPARQADVLGVTEYGYEFASAVARGNLVAVQFHPEKSGRPGLSILRNFIAWDGKEGADA
ncbi:MAG: imidazole glycerol phosphate synthase subunit HisH [Desulfarculus sp.]|nr:imidazole glycerol phosphate synthase subunit HisH [Desulfarculus sp.]